MPIWYLCVGKSPDFKGPVAMPQINPSMTATTISCRVHCARDFVLDPSDTHAEAERLFELEIQSLCSDMVSIDEGMPRFVTRCVCNRVQSLHDCVQRGDVRRPAAALAASRLQTLPKPIRWTASLLYVIMEASKHIAQCSCLTHTLSWGTCPTLLTGPAPDERPHHARPPLHLLTAFGFAMRRRVANTLDAKWRDELLAYGSAPWLMGMVSSHPNGSAYGYAMTFPQKLKDVPNFRWQAQWRRWHARRARLVWATVHL